MQTVLRKQEIKIINLKWQLFPLILICRFFLFKFSRVQAVDDIDILCKFLENSQNPDCIVYTRNKSFQLKIATFPLLIVQFLFKINRVQAVEDIDKLCRFHKNLTKNVDFIL